ncbi:hypothetical protein K439DRAFT_1350873 [Ramaria rubella]|nr:hypothetical protein K439DRAFT_1350873 [Ramaria rubella]
MHRRTSFFLFAILATSGVVNAWFRVACTTPLVSERIDPIISPGQNPSNHVHTVHGGQNFSPNVTYDTLIASACTSCEVSQDNTNYWFPKLYYQDKQNGTFEEVNNGGLLVYYQNRGDLDTSNGGPGLTAFPPGFRMITGNPALRSMKFPVGDANQDQLRQRAIEWACIGDPGYDNDDSGDGFPTTDCTGGFNARLHFPNCWDGVNLDSPDHMSHTAFASGLDNGACPEGFPVGLITVFFEVTWDVHSFADRWDPSTEAWPFVYSTGDPTGYSWHGDFLNGWNQEALQNAISDCNNADNADQMAGDTEACPYLTVLPAATVETCKTAPIVNEVVGGTLTTLPGCNPIQTGPQDATLYSAANCPI